MAGDVRVVGFVLGGGVDCGMRVWGWTAVAMELAVVVEVCPPEQQGWARRRWWGVMGLTMAVSLARGRL